MAIDSIARGLAAYANTAAGIYSAGGAIFLPQDIILVCAGQSNMAGWTVNSGSRELTTDDIFDDRVRAYDLGRGPELIDNGDFETGVTTGWASSGCSLAVNEGVLELRSASTSTANATYALTGLTIGVTYELTALIDNLTTNIILRLGSLTEVKGIRFSLTDFKGSGLLVPMRAQFVATATNHSVSISVNNSGVTPTGTVFARAKNVSLKEVLGTGISYTKPVIPAFSDLDFTNISAMGIDPACHMAQRLLDRQIAKRVTIIPTAVGGTGFSDNNWNPPSDPRYADTVTKLTAAMAANPFAVPVLAWVQGEQDGTAGWSQDEYITAFTAMIEGFRGITGCETMECIIGEMVPEYTNSRYTSSRPLGTQASHRRIDAAHRALPDLIPGVSFVEMDFGYQQASQPYHYNAAGARRLGYLMGEALWTRS